MPLRAALPKCLRSLWVGKQWERETTYCRRKCFPATKNGNHRKAWALREMDKGGERKMLKVWISKIWWCLNVELLYSREGRWVNTYRNETWREGGWWWQPIQHRIKQTGERSARVESDKQAAIRRLGGWAIGDPGADRLCTPLDLNTHLHTHTRFKREGQC